MPTPPERGNGPGPDRRRRFRRVAAVRRRRVAHARARSTERASSRLLEFDSANTPQSTVSAGRCSSYQSAPLLTVPFLGSSRTACANLGGCLRQEAHDVVGHEREARDDILLRVGVLGMHCEGDALRPRLERGVLLADRKIEILQHDLVVDDVDRCRGDLRAFVGSARQVRPGSTGTLQVTCIAPQNERTGDEADDAGQTAHRQHQQMRIAHGQGAGERVLIAADTPRTEQCPGERRVAIGDLLSQDATQRRAGYQRKPRRSRPGDGQVHHADRLSCAAVQCGQRVEMKESRLHESTFRSYAFARSSLGGDHGAGRARPKPSRRSCWSSQTLASQSDASAAGSRASTTSNQ